MGETNITERLITFYCQMPVFVTLGIRYILTCFTDAYQWLTFSVSTISETAGRGFAKVVHVEAAAVSYFDHSIPVAAIVSPVEANFSVDQLVPCGRKTSGNPSRSMSTTAFLRNAWCGHVISCQSSETVPTSLERAVAEYRWVHLCLGSVCLIQPLVYPALLRLSWCCVEIIS